VELTDAIGGGPGRPGESNIQGTGTLISKAAYPVSDVAKWPERLRSEPGVYEIVALDRAGRPKAMPRAGGVDERGVLYIGQGQKIRDRLRKLSRGLFQGTKGHIAGRAYKARPAIQAIAPMRDLAFRFEHCDDPKKREKLRLDRYIRKFGEVPPLNAQT